MIFTGNIRYRKSFSGNMIVQVEYRYQHSMSNYNLNDAEDRIAWKDATGEDLQKMESAVTIV